MPKPKAPRHGSMQVWPRKRSTRRYARVRNFALNQEGMLAFAGYKMGMTHVMAFDSYKNSMTKNETIALPATIIECPAMRVFSVRGYTHDHYGYKVAQEVVVIGKDKHLGRKIRAPKTAAHSIDKLSEDLDDYTIIVSTQPHLTGIGQKKPQLTEFEVGGKTPADKLAFIKSIIGKEIKASDLFKAGDYVDFHAVTTGKGYQGPVKRFGIGLKPHKSEKGRRRPGVIAGGWSAQQHTMYRVAFAGQMGYHQRVQYNNQILKITDKPEEVNPKGGFIHYGTGRSGNEFIIVQGSVPGTKKRLITLVKAVRLKQALPAPSVEYISQESQQGK
jgi:large subunit ribosomal protein L3